MNTMSKEVIEILTNAGWTPEREIMVNEIVDLLVGRGFTVTEPIVKFLKKFGMLNIKSPSVIPYETRKKHGFKDYDEHTTDVFSVLGDAGDSYCTVPYDEFIDERLTIVGSAQNKHLDFMISESGKFYCSEGKLGDTVEEAWECILTKRIAMIPWIYLD